MNTIAAPVAIPRRSRRAWLMQIMFVPLVIISVWEVWAVLAQDPRAPAPTRVIESLIDLVAHGGLVSATLQSLGRVVSGFAIALVVGVVLGILMGSNRWARNLLDPIVESFRPIAPMAILPIAILWFGTGTPAALSIVAYAAFFPLLLNTVHGVSRVDRKLVLAARTMGVPRWRILTKVVLPASLPSVLLGSRLAMGVAWTAIVAAELGVGAKSGGGGSGGIGAMMFVFYAYNVDLNAIVVCMIVVGVVALLIDRLFRFAERRLMPWRT
ncbi:MAG TPA: ABC transporter permease [Casimicrobiaceae bacterium]|nr:ABC transporter permease [Casimicrobiaceae bacterium]